MKKKYKNVKLIEANAGTGKTFLIIKLFLYNLFGINNEKKEYSINKILIITFTKNSTNELKKRIFNELYSMYLSLLKNNKKHKLYLTIKKKKKNTKKIITIIKKSLFNINKISIFTIHKFCRIILKKNFLLKNKFTKKNEEEYLNICSTYDFWRQNFYCLNKNISKIIYGYWKNPEKLYFSIKNWINIKEKFLILFKNKNINFLKKHKKNIKKIKKFKKFWIKNYHFMINFIQLNIKHKRTYNKKNLKKWLKKIFIWTQKKTKNYIYPKEILHFKKEKIIKNLKNLKIINKKIFNIIKKINFFIKKKFSIKNNILYKAILNINQIKKKKKKQYFTFDDLIFKTFKTILKNKKISSNIRKKYPIVYIDEFQDTDSFQIKIFKKIYINKKNKKLFLFGDPKQTIYSFRGADIFSYFKIKSKINKIITLKKNWRSSKNIIDTINFLFKNSKHPFFFKKIKYKKSTYPKKSKYMNLLIKKKNQNSLNFHYRKKPFKSIKKYYNWISKKCANHILYIKNKIRKKQAFLKINKKKKLLKIKDICIIVNNSQESSIIQKYLNKKKINSFFTSNKKNIFQKSESKELFYILKSIKSLKNLTMFQNALSTSILNINNNIIKKNLYSIKTKSYLTKIFQLYKKNWNKYGILNLIKEILFNNKFQTKEFYKLKKKKIINLIKIGEILEKKSILRKSKTNLLNWFKKKIYFEKKQIKNQYSIEKILNKKKCIQITTIHKSKGLSYPIVWIPFASNSIKNKKKKFIFHNEKLITTINLDKNKKGLKKEKKELLSEKIRLFYVSITRTIFNCNIGFCYIKKKFNKKKLKKNIFNYLLNIKQINNKKKLKKERKKIKKNCKNINFIKKFYIIKKNKKKTNIKKKNHKKNNKKKKNKTKKKYKFLNWKNSSYTKIIHKINKTKKIFFQKPKKKKKYHIKNFPKGKNSGILLHELLKSQNFKKKINKKEINKKLKNNKINKKWKKILKKWIYTILNTKLNKNNLKLSLLKKNNILKELKFSLFLKKKINFININKIIKKKKKKKNNKKITYKNSKLKKYNGILNGSIDVLFKWKKKFYIIDYKSDWLGEKKILYNKKNIKKKINKKKYYIQHYLYSVAIHKYLKKNIKKYNYKNFFGGVFYLFLRGMHKKKKNLGIFFTLPKYKKIKKIEKKFFK